MARQNILPVRPVHYGDLISTEGGSLETYKLAAFSSQSLQMKMHMEQAVPISNGPATVSSFQIGVDCNCERAKGDQQDHQFQERISLRI